jgi:cephalosporin hydroxylase
MMKLSWLWSAQPHVQLTDLAEKYYGSDSNRKQNVYLVEYERLFGAMRTSPIRLLELGVGASIHLWADYFPRATIVGLDIAKKPKDFPVDQRVHFVQASQDDPTIAARCVAAGRGQFDIIVDDASHIGRLTATAFSRLFVHALRPGGWYVIEDICTAFLPEFPDSEPFTTLEPGEPADERRFISHQAGMVGVVKQLFDHVQAPTATGAYSQYPIERMHVLTNIAIVKKAY